MSVLARMSIEEAQKHKWAARVERRQNAEEWEGAHPLLELHDEQIDSLNYCDESERQGDPVPEIRAEIMDVLRKIRAELRVRELV